MLNLNFDLETIEERKRYLETYMPPNVNAKECELAADYLLWGEKDGKPMTARKSHRAPRETAAKVVSYETLLESPYFNESWIATTPYQYRKQKFSRERAMSLAPDVFAPLFREIDRLELTIAIFDFKTGRRNIPPREALISRFSDEELAAIGREAEQLTSKKRLVLKKTLVENRRQQFTLLDSFVATHQRRTIPVLPMEIIPEEIPILPALSEEARVPFARLTPSQITPEEVAAMAEKNGSTIAGFDLRRPECVAILISNYYEMRGSRKTVDLRHIFEYYMKEGSNWMTPAQRYILALKIKGKTNGEIARRTNEKFGTHYRPNYISTIYHKHIIEMIAGAAKWHERLIEELPHPEHWQICSKCGEEKLLAEENYCHRSKRPNGFSTRCKVCEKERRERKKEMKAKENGNV